MILDIQFIPNVSGEGFQCVQASMQSAIKHFLNKDFSLEELDKLTGRKQGFFTWTTQVIPVLFDLGLEVKYYSKAELEPFLEGEPFIRRHFGASADKILKLSDFPVFVESIKKTLKLGLFEKRILSLPEIQDFISRGCVLLVLVDFNKLISRQGLYQGHMIVLTGFDEENIFFHQSGPMNPTANQKASKKVFLEAWNAEGTDNDVVVVFGKRKPKN